MNKKTYIIPNWPAAPYIRAYTSTRQHGNFAGYVGDDADTVTTNMNALVSDLELPETPLCLQQVHGNRIVRIEEHQTPPEADASMTQRRNKICAVLTADCIPLLVCNRETTEVAAIHAGWKGLLAGVIETSIQAMQSAPDDLLVWLGPALSQKNFEMGDEVYADFLNTNPDFGSAFKRYQDRWYLDGYAIARQQLKQAGISEIYGGDFCTYDDNARFYSYRREQGKTGRMISFIYIT